MEHDEAICSTLAPRFRSLHAAEEYASGLWLGGGLCDWRQNVGTEHRKQLKNARQEHLHIFPVRFRQPRAAGLVLFEREPVNLGCFGQQSALEISHVRLCKILVLADEDDGRNPEFFRFVLLQSVTNDLGLSDVGPGCICKRVATDEDINSCLLQFLASEKLIELRTGSSYGLAGPV